MDKRVKTITDMLSKKVNAFCREEAARLEGAESAARKGKVKAFVRCGWSATKIVKESLEAVGAGLSGAGAPLAAKKIVDLARDIKDLFEDLTGRIRDEKKQRSLVKGNLAQIRKLKQNRDLKESHLRKLEDSIKLYEEKLDSVEIQVRNASRKLNAMLKEVSRLDGADQGAVRLAEKGVDQLLKEIVELSVGLKRGREFRKKAMLQLGSSRKAAKKGGFFSLEVFDTLNNLFKDVSDLFEDFSLAILDKIITKFSEA